MRRLPGLAALAVLLAAAGSVSAQSGIDGTLKNGTTGGPGHADRINLMRLAGGPSTVATLTDVEGKFHFDLSAPGPYLVQVHYQGAFYTEQVPPMERGVATPEVTVFEVTQDASRLTVSLPHWIAIIDGPRINVSRVYEIHNDAKPPRTVIGDPGVFRFDVPDAADAVQASVSTGRMPLRMDPVETRDGKGKTIAFPIRPGVTRYQIEYELKYPGSIELKETLYQGATSLTAIVLPADVTAEASGLDAQGKSEREGIAFLTFTGKDLKPGQTVSLRLSGEATAPRPPASATGGDAGQEQGSEGGAPALDGEPKEVEPAAVRGWRKYAVLAGSAALLAAALVLALRRPAPRPGAGTARRRTTPLADSMLDQIASLDDRYAASELGKAEHDQRRSELKRQLREELASARRRKKTA